MVHWEEWTRHCVKSWRIGETLFLWNAEAWFNHAISPAIANGAQAWEGWAAIQGCAERYCLWIFRLNDSIQPRLKGFYTAAYAISRSLLLGDHDYVRNLRRSLSRSVSSHCVETWRVGEHIKSPPCKNNTLKTTPNLIEELHGSEHAYLKMASINTAPSHSISLGRRLKQQ